MLLRQVSVLRHLRTGEQSIAKPAFIYAFDNLGLDRFTELCGLLLAECFRGFLLGGVGADGGLDGELDKILGEWRPESVSPLLSEIIHPGQVVVFNSNTGEQHALVKHRHVSNW